MKKKKKKAKLKQTYLSSIIIKSYLFLPFFFFVNSRDYLAIDPPVAPWQKAFMPCNLAFNREDEAFTLGFQMRVSRVQTHADTKRTPGQFCHPGQAEKPQTSPPESPWRGLHTPEEAGGRRGAAAKGSVPLRGDAPRSPLSRRGAPGA